MDDATVKINFNPRPVQSARPRAYGRRASDQTPSVAGGAAIGYASLLVVGLLVYRFFFPAPQPQTTVAAVAPPVASPAASPSAPSGRTLLVDPVCGRAVDPSLSKWVLTMGKNQVYFDTMQCLAAFHADPVKYAKTRVRVSVQPGSEAAPVAAAPPAPAAAPVAPVAPVEPVEPMPANPPPQPEELNAMDPPPPEEAPVIEEPRRDDAVGADAPSVEEAPPFATDPTQPLPGGPPAGSQPPLGMPRVKK